MSIKYRKALLVILVVASIAIKHFALPLKKKDSMRR